MKKIFLLLTISGLFISCGAFNKAEGHLHYSSTISTGQALIDLKEALDSGAINQAEYDTLKQKIINNVVDFPELIDKIDLNWKLLRD